MGANPVEGVHHFGPDVTPKEGQDVGAANLETTGASFVGEGHVEFGGGDLTALEAGPGVGVGVGRVDGADHVAGEPPLGFVAIEGLEGARQDDPTEVPEDGSKDLLSGVLKGHNPIVGRYRPRPVTSG